MLEPSDIVDQVVAKIKLIPAILTAMNEDPENIKSYDDTYPLAVNRLEAIKNLRSPGILVMWRRTGESSAGWKWAHFISIYIRPRKNESYSDLFYKLLNGTPTGAPAAFMDMELVDDCNAARLENDAEPTIDENGVEYMEINLRLEER